MVLILWPPGVTATKKQKTGCHQQQKIAANKYLVAIKIIGGRPKKMVATKNSLVAAITKGGCQKKQMSMPQNCTFYI